jgi:hypothetical protein
LKGLDGQVPVGRLQQALEPGLSGAQVQDGQGPGLTVDPARLDNAPVGAALDPDVLQARHALCIHGLMATVNAIYHQ